MTYKENTNLEGLETPFTPKFWAKLEDQAKQEMVNHPKHYDKGNPAYEPYKVIGEWRCNFNIGNAIKYLARYKSKWNPIEDLEKAKVYIDFEIESLKSKIHDEPSRDFQNEGKIKANPTESEETDDSENDSQETHTAEEISRGERIIDEANKALDDGASRIDVMRNILKMSDDEIAEAARLCGKKNGYVKIADKIAKAVSNVSNCRGRYFTRF